MDNYRMIKLLLPNNNLINIQLSGEETELKELISTITDLSPSQIKGIKDSQGNYYTFSSAMKSLNVINNKQQNYFELIWSKSSKHNTLSPLLPKYTYDHRQNIILNSSPKVGHYYANYYFNKKYQSNANTNTNNALLNNNNNINYNNFNKNEMYHTYLRHFHENKLINDSQYLDIMKLINANNKELLRRFDLFICGKLTLNSFISCITCIDLLHEDKRNDVVNEVDALCDICVYFGEDDMKILRQMIQYENENALKAVNAYLKDKDITLFVEALNKVLTVFKNKSQCFKMKPKSSLNVGSNSNNNNVDNVDEFNLNENKNYKMYSEKGNTNKKNVFAIKKSSTNDLRKSSVQYESTHKGIKKKLPSSQNVGNNEHDNDNNNNHNNKHRESKYKRNGNNDDDEEDDDKDSYLYTQQSNKVRESVDFGNNSNSNNNGNNNFNINPNKKITNKQSNKMVNDTTHKSNSNNNSSSKTKSLKTLKKRNKTQQDFRATEGNNNSVNHNNINNNPNNMKDYFTITNNTFNNGNTIVTTNSQDKPKAKASKHNLRLKSGKLINTAAISSSITNTNNNVLTSSITNTSPNKDNTKPKNSSSLLNTSPSKNNNTSIPLVNKDNVIDYIKTKLNKVNYIYFNYLIKNKADIKNELISLINSNNKNDNLNNNFTSKAVNICIESHLKNDLINQSEKTKYLLNASDFELLFQLTRKDDNQILNVFKTFETNNNKELLQKEIFNIIQDQKNQSDASSNSDNNNNNSNHNNNNQSKQLNNNKQSSTFSFEETSRMFLKDIKELNLSNKEIEKVNLLIKMNNSKLISLIKEYSLNPNIKLYKDQIISLTATSAVNQGSVILKKLESRGNNNSNEYAKKVFRFSDKKINNNILNNNKHENKNESRHQSKGEANLLQPQQQQQQQQQQQFASVQQLFAYFAHERTFTNQQLSILSTLLKTCSNNVGTTVGAYGMELEVSLRNFLSLEHEAQKTKLKDLIKKLISILTACTKRIKEDSATDSSNSTANTPLRDLTKTPDTIKRTKTELNCFLRSKEEQQQSKKEKNIIEKQKEIITLLYKEKCISKKTYKLILQKIEENEQSLIAAFEVYAVTKNHYEFIETLNIIAELSENYKGMFCTLLNQSTFTMKEQEKLISLYNQKDENLFSFLELYDKTKDKEDFYESLTIQLKKIEED